jgi:6-phosphofructokinase
MYGNICFIGNNATDAASAKKYYYFQRLMGQEPSHLALEVALLTQPNFTILAEEVKNRNITLADIVKQIADMVEQRAAKNLHYGSVIIPEVNIISNVMLYYYSLLLMSCVLGSY